MKISRLYEKKKPVISFEVFPPKPGGGFSGIYDTIGRIKPLNPDFISVTYGAAGGTRARTVEIASAIRNRFALESLMHLTCVNSTLGEIDSVLKEVEEGHLENILALRGDIPENGGDSPPNPDLRYGCELVAYLKKNWDFCVGVAAYPEKHPESGDLEEDTKYLKMKADAGADFIITQLFFVNGHFRRFMDRIRGAGIKLPVSAGIMPVFSASLVKKIVSLSGAQIPPELENLIDKYGDNPEDMKKAGVEYAARQIRELIDSGADGIHIYIMNRPEIAESIIRLI